MSLQPNVPAPISNVCGEKEGPQGGGEGSGGAHGGHGSGAVTGGEAGGHGEVEGGHDSRHQFLNLSSEPCAILHEM